MLVKELDIEAAFPTIKLATSPSPLDGALFREIADGLRKLAHRCRPAVSRRELLKLAASFDRRADCFDSRTR